MLRPPHINESHWNEWVNDSAVDPDLISLNIISLSNYEPHERLLYNLPDRDRRNDGRVRDWVLRRYAHTEHGGWWCSGVDVLTGEDSQWGCFKPDEAKQEIEYNRQGHFKKAKSIKYEHPPKTNTEIFALAVPLHIWKAIALRYDVPLPDNITVTPQGRAIGFWTWLIANPSIPLIITEGAKKAGAIITAHYVAIALPGINNGYRQPKDDRGHKIGKPYLIPQLQAFAQAGREIIFAFDNDTKPSTVKNVQTAIKKTGGLFEKEGLMVSVITWNTSEKGIDDLIVNKGVDFFHALYNARIPLSKFRLSSLLDLSSYNPLYINKRYLKNENLTPPTDAQIIGISSAKGTGKTQWLSRIVEAATDRGQRVIILCHREQLAIALSHRFGIDYRTEVKTSITKGALGYTLCIDSLHPHANPPFNSLEWQNALVIIDEAEQVFWHLLDSSTCQKNRVAIIDSFKQLLLTAVGTGGKVYLADADLSPIAIEYVRSLIGFPVKTWVVENQFLPNQGKRELITYSGSDPREMLANLCDRISQGEKPLIHTTGQKAQSKYGSINLESNLKKKFPHLKILRIDRESVAEPGHPAYGCMGNLNAILPFYDIVICSPVVETGVSIDIKNHFDSVWCIAYGVQTVDAVCQTVERLRDDVPRHLWAKATAKNNRIGNGSTNVKSLLASSHKLTRANISLLQQADIDELEDLDVNASVESLNTWAKRACVVNSGKNNYREEIVSKLKNEGYSVIRHGEAAPEVGKIINESLKQTRQENYRVHCKEVPNAKNLTDSELEELKNKRAKTKTERLAERKGNLIKRYGVEVTPELVEKDDKGWYPQLQLHYYLTVGATYLAERDRRSLSTMKEHRLGKVFKPDINKRQLSAKVKALELIEIEQFLNPDAEFTKDTLNDWLQKVIKLRFDLKTLLGVTINPEKDSAIAVAQRILKKLELKLEFLHQVRIEGKPTRVYKGCNLDPDGRSLVFQNWLAMEAVTPFCKEELYTKEGVTAA